MSALLDDALELAALLRPAWTEVSAGLPGWHPRCEVPPDPDPDPAADPDPDPPNPDPDPTPDDSPKGKGEPDWKAMARKHEREAKAARAREKELADKLSAREDADKSEHEKAVEAARQEGEQSAASKYEQERRTDRIENAVTALSLRGFKAKVDDKDVTLRFADPDDAQLRVDRALRVGDLAYDDIYSDGKVDKAAVTVFLTEVLEEHPRLRATDGNGSGKPSERVDFDGGKGKGGGGKSLEDMSPADHLKEIQAANRAGV